MKFKRLIVCLVFALGLLSGCSKSDEEQFSIHMERGNSYMQEGKGEEAILEFKNALQIKPDSAEVYHPLAKALLSRGKAREAFQALRKAVEKDPGNIEAQLELGNIYLLGNTLDKAEAAAQAALARDPERAEAHVLLGNIFVRQNESQKALTHFDKAIALKPEDMRFPVAKAVALLTLKQPEEAKKIVEKILQKNKNNLDALNLRVNIAYMLNDDSTVEDSYNRLTEAEPANIQTWLKYGDYLISKNRDPEALKKYRRAAEEENNSTIGLERIAGTLLKNNDLNGAKKATNDILIKNAKSEGGLFYKGRIALIEENLDEARTIFQRLLADNPNNVQAEYFLAFTHYRQRNLQQARASLLHLLEIKPDMPMATALLAQVCLEQKDFDSALNHAKELLKDGGVPPQVAIVYGSAQWGLGKEKEAREIFKKLADALPENPIVQQQLGLALYMEKRFDEALASFKKALGIAPKDKKSLAMATSVFMAQNKPDEAVSFLLNHIEKTGESTGARELLGEIYYKKGDLETARKNAEKAIEINPDATEAYALLAKLHRGPDANKKAIADLEKGLKTNPNHLTSLMLLGFHYDSAKEYEKANAAYRRIIESHPNSAPALNNLAWNLAEYGGNIDEALKFAEKAVEIAPESMSINETLGWIYVKKGVYQKALSHLEHAESQLSENPVFNYHLGKAYAGSGQDEKAISSLKRAIQLSDSFPGADDAKSVLAKLESN